MARRREKFGDRMPILAEEGSLDKGKDVNKDTSSNKQWDTNDWDPDLPYGGKVYLPRKKLQDPLWIRIWEISAIVFTISFALYAYFYFDHLHFNVTKGYAHLGYATAQHQVGQRFLHGVGAQKDHHVAMEWFKKAADQGHPHASYNLAVGHLKGYRKDLLKEGEPHKLIQHAASNGVKEAHKVLNDVCAKGGCR